jgi:hypothetical protein
MSADESRERLYALLPAVYRNRDAGRGEPLRALMGILDEQLALLERDVAGLYDDWFIETCEEWVIPYVGDLLGVRLLHDVDSAGVYSQRALVANTLSFRRRKGTLSMLEDLARDVTGWRAKAVAFFELLGWNQNVNHLRMEPAPQGDFEGSGPLEPPAFDRVGTVNLRNLDVVDRIGGPFDEVAHTVDVRPLDQTEGWYDVRNLGLFLWRLGSYPMLRATPRHSATHADGFHFSPLGNPAPLFTNPQRKEDEHGLAGETHVPGPVRPVAFFQRPEVYYGEGADSSLAIYGLPVTDDEPSTDPDEIALVPVESILWRDLNPWSSPPSGRVAVDVERGRLAYAKGEAPPDGKVQVSYHYGFSADVGGGPYDRRAGLEKPGDGDWQGRVPGDFPTLAAALAEWMDSDDRRGIVTITDNGTYAEELALALAGDRHLILQADDRNRPTVRLLAGEERGVLRIQGGKGGKGGEAALTLNGLLVEGGLVVEAGRLGALEILHSTLVPGRALDETGEPVAAAEASLVVEPGNPDLEVTIEHSLVGALRIPADAAGLTVRDSIVDRPPTPEPALDPEREVEMVLVLEPEPEPAAPAPRVALAADDDGHEPGPRTTFERATVFGDVRVETLALASESIFTHRVIAQRRQEGCVRFSYLDDQLSITPRRFRCQPDLALARRREALGAESLPAAEAARLRSRLRPVFTAERYGAPGYAQLARTTAEEVRGGAEDGSEMGVYEHLKQPQREANLRIRLDEYLPYGLAAGWIHVT